MAEEPGADLTELQKRIEHTEAIAEDEEVTTSASASEIKVGWVSFASPQKATSP